MAYLVDHMGIGVSIRRAFQLPFQTLVLCGSDDGRVLPMERTIDPDRKPFLLLLNSLKM